MSPRPSFYRRRGKRLLDLALALPGLAAVGPLLLLIAGLIKLFDPGPVFFMQTRVGLGFRPFKIIKFRSMRTGAVGPSVTGADDPRTTPIGRLLRKTKLDELPQLLNVVRGEMSLVGPRPEVPEYVELFKEDYRHILTVRPGITDYAAIVYRDESAALAAFDDAERGYVSSILPRKLALYRRYIAEMGLSTDVRLLLATLRRLAA